MKRLWIILVLALAAAGAGYWWTHRGSSTAAIYQTEKVGRGDIQEVIPATGTLEPTESVDIGSQVTGQIKEFGKDPRDPNKTIDFLTEVEPDTVLAKIDDSLYQADYNQAQAQLDSAKANLDVANANIEQYKAKLTQAENDWNRAQALGPGEALAKTTYDNYQATYLTAKAQLAVGNAAVEQAQAAITQAQADVFRAQRNLNYCVIKATVKGTVIDRRVNIGQTVVSSLSASSLFLIGTDMSKMQIWVSINEADSSRIHAGMPVTFTLDGMDRVFNGVTGKLRWNATMTQNVVTYTVEVNVDNTDGVLIPYRTANVKFLAAEQKDVLMVPNAALRWRPRDADAGMADNGNGEAGSGATGGAPAAASGSAAGSGATGGTGTGRGRGRGNRANGNVSGAIAKQGTVYILSNGQPKAVAVQLGITDDVDTAVLGGDLKDGDEIITGTITADDSNGGTTNPFAPSFFRGGRGGGGGRRGG
ncbi:MAG TPA: HlyD family efflux transporter periplasmic adaptor subunit [Opitutales bacterium]|nr:HlyD family efflux transporter periplasmic adaptor subunit [Opitutales bacterium]